MTLDNFCEFVKKIHANPSMRITNLTIRDFTNLQNHLQECKQCETLADEVLSNDKNYKPDPKLNDGRWN